MTASHTTHRHPAAALAALALLLTTAFALTSCAASPSGPSALAARADKVTGRRKPC